ncbi:ROK family glucokinase [Halobacillus sp. K22]|uniref:ROK family glucokinase n=1 Tax=Halobacillus sp. K22 TaxID=3457431 RepID=UPI003FCEA509
MEKNIFLAADIGGTTVKLAVIKHNGEIVRKWEIETNRENGGEGIAEDIHQAFKSSLEELHIDKKQVAGIGAGAPGFVDPNSGFIHEAVNIGWKNYDFGAILSELTGFPVWVDNDANLAALGEKWLGAGEGAEELIAVTLGTGVGGGIIANGEILNGVNGTAGEIGHITVVPEGGAPCNCGKTGCLETLASATGIVRLAKEAIQSAPASTLQNIPSDQLTAKDVFEAAEQGDEAAVTVIEKVTDLLGITIANLAIAINPEKIIIGGGVSQAGSQLMDPLKAAYKKYALPRTFEATSFDVAKLGNDAGVIGGAFLVKANQ